MKKMDNVREKILNQSSYWVEGINSFLYNAILDYMETNNINRTELAEHLGISKGRVSQILNDGEINFSIEKVIQIALKIDKFPVFEFKDKKEYLKDINSIKRIEKNVTNYESGSFFEIYPKNKNRGKVIPLFKTNEFNNQLAL
jgi:transcriptional regulator with XRE-family HTH domain